MDKYAASGTDNIRKRFTGYEKDDETGLDFAEARMYQNRHGRFTTVDPLLGSSSAVNPQTFNRYTYTGNNPINYTDPSGLTWCGQGGNGNGYGDIQWHGGVGSKCDEGWEAIDLDQAYTCNIGPCKYGTTSYTPGTVFRYKADGTYSAALGDPGRQSQAAVAQSGEVVAGTNTVAGTTASEAVSTAASGESDGVTPLPSGDAMVLPLCGSPSVPCTLEPPARTIQRLDTSNNPPLKTVEAIAELAEWGSLIPGLNVPFSIIAGIVRFGQGNFSQAGTNFAAVIPLAGRLGKVKRLAEEATTGGKFLFEAWHSGTFVNKTQSVTYHLMKHGKGRTAVEYTKDAMTFFGKNKSLGTNVILKDGTKGIKIQTKQFIDGKPVKMGGFWTKGGKLVTFWD